MAPVIDPKWLNNNLGDSNDGRLIRNPPDIELQI